MKSFFARCLKIEIFWSFQFYYEILWFIAGVVDVVDALFRIVNCQIP